MIVREPLSSPNFLRGLVCGTDRETLGSALNQVHQMASEMSMTVA